MPDQFDDLIRTKRAAQSARDATRARDALRHAEELRQSMKSASERAVSRLPEALQVAKLLQCEGRKAIRKVYFYGIQPGYERRVDAPPFPPDMEFSREALGRSHLWLFRPGWRIGLVRVPLRPTRAPMAIGPQGLISLSVLTEMGHYQLAPGNDIDAAETLTAFIDTVAEYLARLRISHNR
jgi:hypothetical protein